MISARRLTALLEPKASWLPDQQRASLHGRANG